MRKTQTVVCVLVDVTLTALPLAAACVAELHAQTATDRLNELLGGPAPEPSCCPSRDWYRWTDRQAVVHLALNTAGESQRVGPSSLARDTLKRVRNLASPTLGGRSCGAALTSPP